MCRSRIARSVCVVTLPRHATVLTICAAFLGIDIGSQTIVGTYANVGFQLAILLHREAIKAGKVGGAMIGSTLSAIVVNAAHLPRSEAKT